MSRQQTLQLGIAVLLVMLFLIGCGSPATVPAPEAPAATSTPEPPTPIPPTATPVPPTATPTPIPPTPITPTPTTACEATCDIYSRGANFRFSITCESGQTEQTTAVSYEGGGIKITGKRTYQTSGNTYDFTAFIEAKEGSRMVKTEVTRGVFGEAPQTGEKRPVKPTKKNFSGFA